jgi:glycosyltransferase involved in cell wall biosynthesis
MIPLAAKEIFAANPNFIECVRLSLKRIEKTQPHIITSSEFSKKDILKYADVLEKKIRVVYLMSDKRELYPDFDNDFSFDDFSVKEPYILIMGRIEVQKNNVRIIQAFNEISDKIPNVKLVFAGAARSQLKSYSDTVENALSEINCRDRIKFLGVVSDDDKRVLMSNAKCLCFPSLYEGFGYPILEGMMCGCPVITSNTTSCPEIARDAAILVDPLDVGNISSAILKLVFDRDLRHELRGKGFKRAKFFDEDKIFKQLEQTFMDAAGYVRKYE